MECPICGLVNPNSALKCDCGHNFTTDKKEEQKSKISSSRNRNSGYFSFRNLVSNSLIKIIYVFGMIGITIAGMNTLQEGVRGSGKIVMVGLAIIGSGKIIMVGLAIVVIGNLLWRIVCEGWILLFSMHEILSSIEKKL